jgi:2-dehydro-3-deoxyphosphogluconate aldolase/(4S)-4-hydroxy-2-oxoglutarate aldolase
MNHKNEREVMTKIQRTLARIEESGIIAIVRTHQPDGLVETARAISAGGIDVVEFTMTTPGALAALEQAHSRLPQRVLLGAGTVLDAEAARLAILAGAQFIVSPTLDRQLIRMCARYAVVAIPGALTPTEALDAVDAGAQLVKISPASLGGHSTSEPCLLLFPS